MFGFLKKKLSNVVESLSKKREEEEKFEEQVGKLEEKIEKEPDRAVKEIEETFKEEKPAIKEYIEQELKQVQEVKKPEEKVSFFKRVIKNVTEKKLTEEEINPILNELGNGLIEADVAYEVVERIKNDLKQPLLSLETKRGETRNVIATRLKNSLMGILNLPTIDLIENSKTKKPYVILFLGFNGSGKTTSLAKLGKWLLDHNYSCVFAAADTFRAASLEQLEEHGRKISIDVVKHKYGADPAAVVYDAIEHAKSKGINFVLADTAGRVHTNRDLLDEMKKIIRVNKPNLKILVIDSMTGNDAVLQARMFNEVDIDGVIFTKVDVNEKGGAILSVAHELKKPILFLCNGQDYESLISFNAKEFVDNLVGE